MSLGQGRRHSSRPVIAEDHVRTRKRTRNSSFDISQLVDDSGISYIIRCILPARSNSYPLGPKAPVALETTHGLRVRETIVRAKFPEPRSLSVARRFRHGPSGEPARRTFRPPMRWMAAKEMTMKDNRSVNALRLAKDAYRCELAVSRTGAFILSGLAEDGARRFRVEFQPQTGLYSTLFIDRGKWSENLLKFRRRLNFIDLSMEVQKTSYDGSGPVMGVSSHLSTTGRSSVSKYQTSGPRDATWSTVDRLASGAVVEGRGSRSKGATSQYRKKNGAGDLVWTKTATVVYDTIAGYDLIPATKEKIALISVSYPDGSQRNIRKWTAHSAGQARWGFRSRFVGSNAAAIQDKGSAGSILVDASGSRTGRAAETVGKYLDGSDESTILSWGRGAGPHGPGGAGAHGQGAATDFTSSRSQGDKGVFEHRSIHMHGFGGGAWVSESDSVTRTTYSDRAVSTSEGIDSDGNYSRTTSTVYNSGEVVIETVSRDATGAGTEHTTHYDKDGKVISDETIDLPTYDSTSGNSGGGNDGDGGNDGGGDGGDDGAIYAGNMDGSQAGDWDGEGGSEEGPSMTPQMNDASVDIVLGEHKTDTSGGDWGSEESSYGAAIGGVLNQASQSFVPVRSSSGWGEAGSESGFDIAQYARRSGIYITMGAADGWDGNNPRALVASLARVVAQASAQIADDGAAHGLARTASANANFSRNVANVLRRANATRMPG